MAKATSLFGLAALVTLGCGGGSGGTLDGGTSLGTACKQSCLVTLSNMVAGCQPSGTCTQQLAGTSSGAICYSNGVKFKVTMTSSSSGAMSMSMSAKKGSATCYSMILDETAAGDVTMTFKNASGSTVATLAAGDTGADTITCPGGSTAPIDPSCQAEMNAAGESAFGDPGQECVSGTCSY